MDSCIAHTIKAFGVQHDPVKGCADMHFSPTFIRTKVNKQTNKQKMINVSFNVNVLLSQNYSIIAKFDKVVMKSYVSTWSPIFNNLVWHLTEYESHI